MTEHYTVLLMAVCDFDIQPSKHQMDIKKHTYKLYKELLTHDFHYSVSQKGSAALQVAKAFDVQWPDIGSRVAIGHPLCQVPRQQTTRHVLCALL